MARIIEYGVDCPHGCDAFASQTAVNILDDGQGPLRIDIEVVIAESTLTCEECGCRFVVGDLQIFGEDECTEESSIDRTPDITFLAQIHIQHFRVCNCLNDSAKCCVAACPCHITKIKATPQ